MCGRVYPIVWLDRSLYPSSWKDWLFPVWGRREGSCKKQSILWTSGILGHRIEVCLFRKPPSGFPKCSHTFRLPPTVSENRHGAFIFIVCCLGLLHSLNRWARIASPLRPESLAPGTGHRARRGCRETCDFFSAKDSGCTGDVILAHPG